MYSEGLIQKTRETFEPQYGRKLTQFEVEEIIGNMTTFAECLVEFDRKQKQAESRKERNITSCNMTAEGVK